MFSEVVQTQNEDNLLFGALDLPLPDRETWSEIILNTPKDLWFYDEYRTVSILALRTHQGGTSLEETENRVTSETFKWTAAAFPELIAYFEKYIFPWSTDRCRIAILHTPPGGTSSTHIDCAPDKIGTLQHKFRLILRGKSSTLYFETADGPVWAPDTEKPFIMDGSWPHGLKNNSDEHKITICLGAPFNFSENYPPMEKMISKTSLRRPSAEQHVFEKKYSKI